MIVGGEKLLELSTSSFAFNPIPPKQIFAFLLQMCLVIALSEPVAGAQTGSDVRKDCQVSEGDRAIRACTAVIESGLENGTRLATVFFNRGNAYSAAGNNDDAIHDYDKAIQLQPRSADAFVSRGTAYELKGACGRAIKDYDEAIRLEPSDAVALYGRGVAYLCLGEHDHSSQNLNQSSQLKSPDENAVSEHDIAYNSRGEYAPPIRRSALETGLESEGQVRPRADSADGEFESARRDFDEAIRLDPGFAQAWNSLGFSYEAIGEYDRAIKDFDEAIRLSPESELALINRGSAFQSKGQYDLAIRDYSEALELRADVSC